MADTADWIRAYPNVWTSQGKFVGAEPLVTKRQEMGKTQDRRALSELLGDCIPHSPRRGQRWRLRKREGGRRGAEEVRAAAPSHFNF